MIPRVGARGIGLDHTDHKCKRKDTTLLLVKERLPILKAIKDATDNAYKQAKAELGDDMDSGDRKTLTINGTKVGSATICEGKTTATVYDPEAYMEWARDNNYPFQVSMPSGLYAKNGPLHVEGDVFVTAQGEVVPGVEARKGEDYLLVKDCKPEMVIPLISQEQFIEAIQEARRLEE